jgi:hypothetical protein
MGPGTSDWYRFLAQTYIYYPPVQFGIPNEGVLTSREGTRYWFDFSCSKDPAEWEDGFIQLLRRKENRYGVGYTYQYTTLGTPGTGDVYYRLDRVITPAGRQILFAYNKAALPNRVTNIHLADSSGTPIMENLVTYDYYDPNDPNDSSDPNFRGQLKWVRKGCSCGGGGGMRVYEYQVCYHGGYSSNEFKALCISKIKDGAGRTLLQNEYDAAFRVHVQTVGAPGQNAQWHFDYDGAASPDVGREALCEHPRIVRQPDEV